MFTYYIQQSLCCFRLEGLVLLNVFLPQCSDQQFIDHGISWMSQCVRGIESALCTETNETAYRVLSMYYTYRIYFFTRIISPRK